MRDGRTLYLGGLLLVCVLLFVASACSAGQQNSSTTNAPTSSLSGRASSQLGILAAGSVLTWIALAGEDGHVASERFEAGSVEGLTDFGNVYGSGEGAFSLAAGLGVMGRLGNRPALTNASMDLGTSLLATSAAALAIKVSVRRTRPNGGPYSFPSGHTAVAFTTATVLEEHFGWRIGIPAYAAAGLTGIARMEDRKHFLSDVVAGATIGIVVGRAVPSRLGGSRCSLVAEGTRVGFRLRL
ncbi:MAG: phosphatase PAP2 family protein [Candidatus Eisenbacteria bacterium]|uniref:Phosphatase PAP2 family protein n=1 Tax=Eiseniibacteriota bacterium TaxID=2212470 RepID=A0A956SGY8_UNCEI|nr:phosphatase PAP2 family protein [Candidatus Eisenbacteria bacterium]